MYSYLFYFITKFRFANIRTTWMYDINNLNLNNYNLDKNANEIPQSTEILNKQDIQFKKASEKNK